jgi:hypothetical protein
MAIKYIGELLPISDIPLLQSELQYLLPTRFQLSTALCPISWVGLRFNIFLLVDYGCIAYEFNSQMANLN